MMIGIIDRNERISESISMELISGGYSTFTRPSIKETNEQSDILLVNNRDFSYQKFISTFGKDVAYCRYVPEGNKLHVRGTYGGGRFVVLPGFSSTPTEIVHEFSRSQII